MRRLLARLERRFGRYAIHNVMSYVVGGMALVFVLGLLRPGYAGFLPLDPVLIRTGQVWRVISFVFMPPPLNPLFLIFALQILWVFGNALEAEWGAFKLNVFYLVGVVGTAVAALVSGHPMDNYYLNLSLFLAFATLFPDYQISLFFILPIRVKWLGMLSAGIVLYGLVRAVGAQQWSAPLAIAAAMANYFLFCGARLVEQIRGVRSAARQAPRRAELARERAEIARRPPRTCVICGLGDDDEGADLRVCTCQEVCGGKATIYCLPHARSHTRRG